MASLFPERLPRNSQALIHFKAGKCEMVEIPGSGGKFRVTPDKRKGTLSLRTQDGLTKIVWTDRTQSGAAGEEVIVFPDEVVFKRVNTGRDGDRVYLLKWNGSSRKQMYWMQDKSAGKDEDNCKRLNELIHNPQLAAAPANGAPDFMQLLGMAGGAPLSSSGRPAPSAAPTANPFMNLDLSNILRTAVPPTAPGGSTSTSAPPVTPAQPTFNLPPPPSAPGNLLSPETMQRLMQGAAQTQAAPNLQDIVIGEDIVASGILQDPAVRAALIQYLPEGQQSEEFLEANIRSSQLRQALGALSAALNSDNYNSVLANLGGLDPSPGTQHLVRGDAVAAFLASLQAANPPEESNSSSGGGGGGGPPPPPSDDDDKMEE